MTTIKNANCRIDDVGAKKGKTTSTKGGGSKNEATATLSTTEENDNNQERKPPDWQRGSKKGKDEHKMWQKQERGDGNVNKREKRERQQSTSVSERIKKHQGTKTQRTNHHTNLPILS